MGSQLQGNTVGDSMLIRRSTTEREKYIKRQTPGDDMGGLDAMN